MPELIVALAIAAVFCALTSSAAFSVSPSVPLSNAPLGLNAKIDGASSLANATLG